MAKKKKSTGPPHEPGVSPGAAAHAPRAGPSNPAGLTSSDRAPPVIVGIGASAGGLAALKKFFAQIPGDTEYVFVVIVHLAPEHHSHLAELLQPHVAVPIQQVSESVALESGRAYIIPPGANLDAIDTHLRLSKLEAQRRERAPINHFFRTLATAHHSNAIGIILTGTGSDGAMGIREIKAHGGVTIAQEPDDAEYDGMPRSAIATGQVDLVLPLDEIPAALIRLGRPRADLAASEDGELADVGVDQMLRQIFELLQTRCNRDYSRYKRTTMLRRVHRRMQLNAIPSVEAYLELLRGQPEEAHRLADDLLVTVTSFFRDPSVFEALEATVIPPMVQGKGADDEVRVWCIGVATGEEAYSLAILLLEAVARQEVRPRLLIIASDLQEKSLKRARDGFYPGELEGTVTAERLKRFFVKVPGGYRVRQEVRELVVFAAHNLLADPPFSRMDLVCCRNLLIYIRREVQPDIAGLLHYALRGNGFLVLGPSETTDANDLFTVTDKAARIYQRRNGPTRETRLPMFRQSRVPHDDGRSSPPERDRPIVYKHLHQSLVQRYAPPSLLVGPDDTIVHVSERAGRFLGHRSGMPTTNVYKLVHESLRLELRTAVPAARQSLAPIRTREIAVPFDGATRMVSLDVRASPDPRQAGFVLVRFDERDPLDAHSEPRSPATEAAARENELQVELERTRAQTQAIVEEFDQSREEMRATSEEMQSTNEELRSTMEELETSKEELQSMNEELQTVNQENRHKVEELALLSNDLHNLLSATEIATLFLDTRLRILRFTPKVAELFNVRGTDRGRPIADLTHHLGYQELERDAQGVLSGVVNFERQVSDESGRWYQVRIMPYRATDDEIEGVVITFMDITNLRRAEDVARESEQRLSRELARAKSLHLASTRLIRGGDIQDLYQQILKEAMTIMRSDFASVHATKQDPSGRQVLRMLAHHGFDPRSAESWRILEFESISACGEALRRGERCVIPNVSESKLLATAASRKAYEQSGIRSVQATPLRTRAGHPVGVISTHWCEPHEPTAGELVAFDVLARQVADLVESAQSNEALRKSEQRYRTLFESIDEGFCILEVLVDEHGAPVDYRFVETNPVFDRETGLVGASGKTIRELIPDPDPLWLENFARIATTSEAPRHEVYSESMKRWFSMFAFRYGLPADRQVGLLISNVTDRKRHEEHLRTVMGELNHRVKNTLATVDAIAQQSLEKAERLDDFAESFRQRLRSIAFAHSLLTKAEWFGTELRQILLVELEPRAGRNESLELAGPVVVVQPNAALSLHMAIHELATNAGKYGSLSVAEGRLSVSWRIVNENESPRLELDWQERGGPPVAEPTRRGFGSQMIDTVIQYDLGGTVAWTFAREGLRWQFSVPWSPAGLDSATGRAAGVDVADVVSPAQRRQPGSAPIGGEGRGRGTVLVIEDNGSLARLVCHHLEQCGFAVAGPARDLTEGSRLVADAKFDLAVLDIDLDGARVDPLARTLRQRGVPFALLTGFDAIDVAPDLRGCDFLIKPIDINALDAWLQRNAPPQAAQKVDLS